MSHPSRPFSILSVPPPSWFSHTPVPIPALQAPHLPTLCPNPMRCVPYSKSSFRLSSNTFIPLLHTPLKWQYPSMVHPSCNRDHRKTVPRLHPESQKDGQGGGKPGFSHHPLEQRTQHTGSVLGPGRIPRERNCWALFHLSGLSLHPDWGFKQAFLTAWRAPLQSDLGLSLQSMEILLVKTID